MRCRRLAIARNVAGFEKVNDEPSAMQSSPRINLKTLAEHLGLRSRAQLETWIAEAGLAVATRRGNMRTIMSMATNPPRRKAVGAINPVDHSIRKREASSGQGSALLTT